MTRRGIWTLDELLGVLLGAARLGGDARTIAAIATALGVPVPLLEVKDADISGILGRGADGASFTDAGRAQ